VYRFEDVIHTSAVERLAALLAILRACPRICHFCGDCLHRRNNTNISLADLGFYLAVIRNDGSESSLAMEVVDDQERFSLSLAP
jgi:hypothetical protein